MIWAFVFPIGFIYLIFRFWFSRRPIIRGGGEFRPPIKHVLDNPDQIRYSLKNFNSPKLTGKLFKLVVWLSYTRFGQIILAPPMMKKSNLDRMRSLYMPENPTLYATPPTPPGDQDHTQTNKELIEKLVENEVKEKDEGFRFPTVADYVRAYQSGVCTPTDVAEAIVKAIKDSNKMSPPLRAIVQTNREVVVTMAEASTQRWKEGKTLSIMDGIPVAIKEEFRVEPYVLRGGSVFTPILSNGVPESVSVQKLKDAGAVIIGVSNMHEFGTGTIGSNPNHLHLTARNPYNPHHYPGGSSSGSAACVAAGLCPVAMGTDGGGSIRIPAATCGVVGIKPTNRLIDGTGGLPTNYSVCASGPLCSSVLDAAITLDIISRETNGDRKLVSLEGVGETRLDGLNFGVYWEYFQHADREIVQKCKAAVSKLQSLGANIVEIKIPELEDSRIAHAISIVCEFASSLGMDMEKHYHELNLESHFLVANGFHFSAIDYINSQKQRTRAIEALKYIFNELKVDVIITPATACPAPAIKPADISHGVLSAIASTEMMRYSFLANLTGVPSLVLPVGYTKSGLPISLQVMGKWYQENKLLKVGWALEKPGFFPIKKPQVYYDLLKMATESHS